MEKNLKQCLIVVLTLLLLNLPLRSAIAATDVYEIIKKHQERYLKIKDYTAFIKNTTLIPKFEGAKDSKDFQITIEMCGKIWCRDINKINGAYKTAYDFKCSKSIHLFDGESLYLYGYPTDRRATKMPMGKDSFERIFPAINMGTKNIMFRSVYLLDEHLSDMNRQSDVNMLPDENIGNRQCYVIEMRQKNTGLVREKAWIEKDTLLLVKKETYEIDKNIITRIELSDIEIDTNLSDDIFTFIPSEGVFVEDRSLGAVKDDDSKKFARISPEELYEEALLRETAEGDINEAMKIYNFILATYGNKSELCAKAQYRLGLCYEKKGDREKAFNLFEELMDKYPGSDIVKMAWEKLGEGKIKSEYRDELAGLLQRIINKAKFDPDTLESDDAVTALGVIGDKRVVADLLEMAKARHAGRILVITALEDIGDKEAMPALKEMAKDNPKADFYIKAVRKIEKRDTPPKIYEETIDETLNRLLKKFRFGDVLDRRYIVITFGIIGRKEAVEPLLEYLKANEERAIYEVATALGRIGDKRAVPVLIEHLGRDYPYFDRTEIIEALINIGDTSAVPVLEGIIKDKSQDSRVIEDAGEALEKLTGRKYPETRRSDTEFYRDVKKREEQDKQSQCRSNLDFIYMELVMYAHKHNHRFPEKLSEVSNHVPIEYFICPFTDTKIENKDEIDEKTGYEYKKGLTLDSNLREKLLWDKEGNHGEKGPFILHVNGDITGPVGEKGEEKDHEAIY